MTSRRRSAPLRSGGRLWGPRRVELGVSIRELARRSGVHRGLLSLMENGRMTPTGSEFDRVMAALESHQVAAEVGPVAGEGAPAPPEAGPA